MNNTMLVVDDVEMNRSILKLLFEKEFDVIEATSGKEALEVLEVCSGNIDIILLDLIMPEMTGSEFLKWHRNDPFVKNVPIVVITSSDKTEDQIEAFQDGANDFIAKPFMPEIVVTRVNNVMASSKRILEMQLEKEELKVQSETDQMTGLYNKVTAEMMIQNELSLYPRGIHAFMVIDIDNFKSVNDNEGHLVGDQTIKIIANQIVSSFRKSDIISRFGGDEFCVFMSNLPNFEIARRKAQEIAILMKYKPNLTLPANVSVSVGLAFSDREELSFDEIFMRADKALYEAKKAGKARVSEYGMPIAQLEAVDQDAVMLISRNRNVCSTIQAVMGVSNTVVESGTVEGIAHIEEVIRDNVVISFIDLSDEKDDGMNLMKKIFLHYPWIKEKPFICVYKEGELSQVKAALSQGAEDILSAPLEMQIVKRSMIKYLGKADSSQDGLFDDSML